LPDPHLNNKTKYFIEAIFRKEAQNKSERFEGGQSG